MDLQLKKPRLLRDKAYINGRWINALSGATFPVINPASGEIIAHVAKCGHDETKLAIAAAERAQRNWSRQTAQYRSSLLNRLFVGMMDNQDDLARLLTAEQGKPLAEARAEIAYSANFIGWFAEEAKRIYGDTISPPTTDKRIVVIKQPIGVVACITPWNFPSAMLGRKIAPALAAGCSVVCKPANHTPLSALAIASLSEELEFPAGLFNVLCGNTREIGDELCYSPIVRKLTFTGSTAVGKELLEKCARTVKRTSMELGGNAPFIVFDDAAVDAAVSGAVASKYRNAGQTCVCANRILVHERVHDSFVDKLNNVVRQFRLGDGGDEHIDIGPLITEAAADNVIAIIEDAVNRGANVVAGGRRGPLGCSFVEPTILTSVTPEMRVYSEEIFGPVAPIIKFKTEAEAIDLANSTPYGLAAYFYTRDIGRLWRVAEKLDHGIVGINEGLISTEVAPFGGIKQSGHGREGSKYGLSDYVDIKYLCIGGIES